VAFRANGKPAYVVVGVDPAVDVALDPLIGLADLLQTLLAQGAVLVERLV
jgi:hypothetical protein